MCWPDVLVGPSAVHLDHVRSLAKPLIAVAAQNCYVEATGAFTGENRYSRSSAPISHGVEAPLTCCSGRVHPTGGARTRSAAMLKDLGVNWVILGHSERRNIFGESDDTVGKKVAFALKTGLSVIACVGEHLSEREAGQTLAVVSRQLAAIKGKRTECRRARRERPRS